MYEYYLLLFCVTSSLSIKTPPDEDFYYGAVVEYSPLRGSSSYDSVMKNVEEYVNLIAEASKKVDIIVFPENGLFSYDHYNTFIEVPLANEVYLTQEDNLHPALQKISDASRRGGIYVVVNLHEKYIAAGTEHHYNTNVIFDRNGTIIARYRKTHLFNEPLETTETPELVYFDSDFGVRFGTFTCFDILFQDPGLQLIKEKNVTDILYPTWWYSQLPFFTAVQTQASWAFSTDANLLAAGGNSVSNSNTGSGIYSGRKGPVIYLQSQRNETCILYAKIIKKGKPGVSVGNFFLPHMYGQRQGLHIWSDPGLPEMKSILIDQNNTTDNSESLQVVINSTDLVHLEKQLCYEQFCCDFNLKISFVYKPKTTKNGNRLVYRLVVFDGVQSFHALYAGVQVCAVISCLNDSLSSCCSSVVNNYEPSIIFHNVSIKTANIANSSFIFPNVFEISNNPDIFGSLMDPNQFYYTSINNTAELSFKSHKLISASIYSRVFSRDSKSTACCFIPINTLIIMTIILIISFKIIKFC